MLSIKAGHSAKYLTDAVATGRENYYTGAVAAGEPPGRWYGKGAAQLGLVGLVDAQDMTALYEHFVDPSDPAFNDPHGWDEASKLGHGGRRYLNAEQIYERLVAAEPHADAERREALRMEASKAERHNVAFFDATFSVQKSVTLLHAAFEAQEVKARKAGRVEEAEAWGSYRQAVEDAIWAGNKAALDYLTEHAGYCRVGHHGGVAGRWADAHEWTVASFFQHDSRDHDPQLHIHNAILNRVQGPDGVWRTLDGRSLFTWRPAAAAVGERVMEEHLTRVLGVLFRTRPDGKAREIVGIPQQVMELFSSRRRAVTAKTGELAGAFEAKHGRAPNAYELDRLSQAATLATRKGKTHDGETTVQRLERVEERMQAEVGGGLAGLAHHVLSLRADPAPAVAEAWSPREVIETALAAVQEKQAAWTEAALIREISNALPDTLGITDGDELAALVDGLAARALRLAVPLDAAKPGDDVLPEALRLANGASAFDAPGRRRYATPQHLHTERLLQAAAVTRDATVAVRGEVVRRFLTQLKASGFELGADQAAAVTGVLTSGARVESLVGPAGTGKSFVVGALATAWRNPPLWADGRRRGVVGLATTQLAADVLTGEGVTAANTAAWLAAQTRLAERRAFDRDRTWVLRAGDLVVVDESSMADTAVLAAVHRRVEEAGAKMLLVGDYRQLGAVGAGGAIDLLATSDGGNAYELVEARRFTHGWERDASLRLRACDPSVLGEYHTNGRIIDAGSFERAEHDAAAAWLADTLAGKHAVLVVDTNDQAARINAHLRTELVRLGKVTEHGVRLGRDGTWAGVGDIVRARRLAWDLVGHDGNRRPPVTQQHYLVIETRPDGSIVVTPATAPRREPGDGPDGGDVAGDRLVLPASYVAADLTLGYAVTVHAAEGITVDVGHEIVTSQTRANALYPGATRGRESNTLHVITQAAPGGADAETGETAKAPRRDPRAVLAEILESADPERSATATAALAADDTANVRTPVERLAAACEIAVAERTTAWLDELVDTGQLTLTERRRLAAEDGGRKLSPLLRRVELAGLDPRAVLVDAITQRPLDGAVQISNVLHSRITDTHVLDPAGNSWADWTPHIGDPAWDRYLSSLAAAADTRQAELGEHTAQEPPPWALEALGRPPTDPERRAGWVARAGQVATYRELVGHADPTDPLGRAPKPGLIEPYTAWRAARRALGRPDTRRAEEEMSDGQLRIRVRAYQREQSWAPRNVTNELAGTIQAADHHRRTVTLRTTEAAAVTDPTQRARLQQQAADAAALVDVLTKRVTQLRRLGDTRSHWWLHTAGTRDAADRAQLELTHRSAFDHTTEQPVSAREWLEADQAARRADDPHRPITETDLTDHHEPSGAVGPVRLADLPDDLRTLASREPAGADEHTVRVPTADQAAEYHRRAQRALHEIQQRDALDAAHAEEEARAERVSRWQTDDHDTPGLQHTHADDVAAGHGTRNRP